MGLEAFISGRPILRFGNESRISILESRISKMEIGKGLLTYEVEQEIHGNPPESTAKSSPFQLTWSFTFLFAIGATGAILGGYTYGILQDDQARSRMYCTDRVMFSTNPQPDSGGEDYNVSSAFVLITKEHEIAHKYRHVQLHLTWQVSPPLVWDQVTPLLLHDFTFLIHPDCIPPPRYLFPNPDVDTVGKCDHLFADGDPYIMQFQSFPTLLSEDFTNPVQCNVSANSSEPLWYGIGQQDFSITTGDATLKTVEVTLLYRGDVDRRWRAPRHCHATCLANG
jgi:hypothetical protein